MALGLDRLNRFGYRFGSLIQAGVRLFVLLILKNTVMLRLFIFKEAGPCFM
jgi:hypothetical protein